MKKALVIGTSIIISSVIFNVDKIYSLFRPVNSIFLDSGKVKLGDVYREKVESSFVVTFDGDKKPAMEVEANTDSLYDAVYDEFKETIKNVNEARDNRDENPLKIEEATWVNNATIKLVTRVTYYSDLQPSFILTIDETTLHYEANAERQKNIMQYINELKKYSNKMLTKYEQNNSYIK